MTRYGLPNQARTAIIKWWPNSQDKVFQGYTISPTEAELLDAGYLPLVKPTPTRWQQIGPQVITETEITYTLTEPTLAEKKLILVDEAYSRAKAIMTEATAKYCPAEMGQWPEMIAAAEAGDFTYFADMTDGDPEAYAAVVLSKRDSLVALRNAVFRARNAHKAAIEDAIDVDDYDTSTGWP